MNIDVGQRKPLVIYHGPVCNDGFGAALAAHVGLSYEAEYYPMNYGKLRDEFMMGTAEHTDLIRDRDVYVLDFSFKYYQLMVMADIAKKVVMIDHHKTAAIEIAEHIGLDSKDKLWRHRSLDGKLEIMYDEMTSGAVQAWRYFAGPDAEMPKLFQALGDYDMWRFSEGGYADCLSLALNTMPKDLRKWQMYINNVECDKLALQGEMLLAYLQQRMDEMISHCLNVEIEGYKLKFINAPYFMASRLGNKIAKAWPLDECHCACVYTITPQGSVILSFRSVNGSARMFAQELGGGGHDNAAGAEVPLITFMKHIYPVPYADMLTRGRMQGSTQPGQTALNQRS